MNNNINGNMNNNINGNINGNVNGKTKKFSNVSINENNFYQHMFLKK